MPDVNLRTALFIVSIFREDPMYEAQGRYAEAIEAYKKYIANTFDNKLIETASDSINQCKRKMELLG